VLLLGQIDPVDLGGLHLLLQYLRDKRIIFACQSKKINNFNTCVQKGSKFHLRVEGGNRYAVGILERVLNHLPCTIVEDEVGFDLVNAIGQAIMFLHLKYACQSRKQLKSKSY
jgi:hypothetical protein